MSSDLEARTAALTKRSVEDGNPSAIDDPTGHEIYPLKSEWGDGPWQRENLDERKFDYLGYSCVVMRHRMGHWCGYVQLPDGHPWVTSPDNGHESRVHGGVTIVSKLPMIGEGTWAGFDCAHSTDHLPAMEAFMKKFNPGHRSLAEMVGLPMEVAYKTIDFAEDQTRVLAEDVHVAANG